MLSLYRNSLTSEDRNSIIYWIERPGDIYNHTIISFSRGRLVVADF